MSLSDLSKRVSHSCGIVVPREFEILYPSIDYSVYHVEGMKGIDDQGSELRSRARSLARELALEVP